MVALLPYILMPAPHGPQLGHSQCLQCWDQYLLVLMAALLYSPLTPVPCSRREWRSAKYNLYSIGISILLLATLLLPHACSP